MAIVAIGFSLHAVGGESVLSAGKKLTSAIVQFPPNRIMTKQQQLLEKYLSLGWAVDQSAKTKKYIVLKKTGESDRLFLGKNEAVRKGRTVADSISLTFLARR